MAPQEGHDFSAMTWSAAFAALCACLKREYVFSHWKALDWDLLQARFAPRIEEAEQHADIPAYYLALREFVYSVPDANLRLWGDHWELPGVATSGTFGMSIVVLANGQVRVTNIFPDSSAFHAGLEVGVLLESWNGVPIAQAIRQTGIMWAKHPPATAIQRHAQQCHFLMRAPVGTTARVEFHTSLATRQIATLVAKECVSQDQGTVQEPAHSSVPIGEEILPSGIGVIVVRSLPGETLPGAMHHVIADYWRTTLSSFRRAGIVGLVVDLRGCAGGNHALAVQLAGSFHRQPLHYATVGYMESPSKVPGRLKRDGRSLVQITPQEPYWQGPVAVIVNAQTMGAAEGFAAAIQQSPRGIVVGTEGSGGAFGPLDGHFPRQVWLPEGYALQFAVEAGLNQDGVIRIESNRFGEGGIQPNVWVPSNLENFRAGWLHGQDIELETAQRVLAPSGKRDTASLRGQRDSRK